jgi:hypothetical protein
VPSKQQRVITSVRTNAPLFNETLSLTTTAEAVSVLAQKNADYLQSMSNCVEKYLNQCGRRWVDMSTIFQFMKV